MTLGAAPAAGHERSAVRGLDLDALDLGALARYVADRLGPHAPVEAEADRLGLATTIGRAQHPTVAGLYLFGRRPQLTRPEWGLGAVVVDGPHIDDPIRAREDLEGPAASLLEGALAFVDTYTHAARAGDAPAEYPRAAVREAVVNALIHRDLRAGGRVCLVVYDDRLEVVSPGPLACQVPPDALALAGGVSSPRNPLVAAVARRLGLMDQIGRGLSLMRRAVGRGGGAARVVASQAAVRVVLTSALTRRGAGQ